MIIKSYETPVQFLFYQDDEYEFSVAVLLDGEPVVEFSVEQSDFEIPGLETLLRKAGLDLELVHTVIKTRGDYFQEQARVGKSDPQTDTQTAAEKNTDPQNRETAGLSKPRTHSPWSGTSQPKAGGASWTDNVVTFDKHDPDAADPWSPGYGSKSTPADVIGPGPPPLHGSADPDWPHYPDQRLDVYDTQKRGLLDFLFDPNIEWSDLYTMYDDREV